MALPYIDFIPSLDVYNTSATPATVTIGEMTREVGVYSSTPTFVMTNCGTIARSIIENVPSSFYDEARKLRLYPIVDIRIHRLNPGEYPATPGWHCDGDVRNGYYEQPDLTQVSKGIHLTYSVSTHTEGISNTEFMISSFKFKLEEEPTDRHTFWRMVHEDLEAYQNPRQVTESKDGSYYIFNSRTLHRAMPARRRGGRMFVRLSMYHKKPLGNGGNISRQEQVWTLSEANGW